MVSAVHLLACVDGSADVPQTLKCAGRLLNNQIKSRYMRHIITHHHQCFSRTASSPRGARRCVPATKSDSTSTKDVADGFVDSSLDEPIAQPKRDACTMAAFSSIHVSIRNSSSVRGNCLHNALCFRQLAQPCVRWLRNSRFHRTKRLRSRSCGLDLDRNDDEYGMRNILESWNLG